MHVLKYCIRFITFILATEIKGQISWTLCDKPAVFGRMVKLKCKLPTLSCCNEFTRKWSKGWDNERIVMNSVSLNESKYEEYLHISTSTSLLTIKNFSEGDVNIPYECTYGFDTARKILLLTAKNFEYHPHEKLPVRLSVNNQQTAKFNITFSKVYPVPNCSAFDNNLNVTSHLSIQVDNNGLFYQSHLQFDYIKTDGCQNLLIQCSIGTTTLIVVNSTLSCSQGTNYWTDAFISATICVLSISMLVVLFALIRYALRKHARSICCNLNSQNTNEEHGTELNIHSQTDRSKDQHRSSLLGTHD